MTVQQLIDELQLIEDKNQNVVMVIRYGSYKDFDLEDKVSVVRIEQFKSDTSNQLDCIMLTHDDLV